MKIAFLVAELHYVMRYGVSTTEHIDLLCDANRKEGLSNFVFKFMRKRVICGIFLLFFNNMFDYQYILFKMFFKPFDCTVPFLRYSNYHVFSILYSPIIKLRTFCPCEILPQNTTVFLKIIHIHSVMHTIGVYLGKRYMKRILDR